MILKPKLQMSVVYSNKKNNNLYTFKFMMKMYYPETMHTPFENSNISILIIGRL